MSKASPSSGQFNELGLWPIHGVGLGVLLGSAILLWTSCLGPLSARRAEIREMKASATERSREIDELTTARQGHEERLADVEASLADIQIELEQFAILNRRLADVVAVATEQGLRIENPRTSDPIAGTWFDTIPMQLTGRARFSDCADFLHRVFEDLVDVDVVGFELSRNLGTPEDSTEFRFDLVWYAAPALAGVNEFE